MTAKSQDAYSARMPLSVLDPNPVVAYRRHWPCVDADVLPTVRVSEWVAAIQADEQASPERKEVAAVLAGFADRDTGRNVRPAVATVAARVGRSPRTVGAHIVGLLASGWLARTGKANRGVIVYALTLTPPTT